MQVIITRAKEGKYDWPARPARPWVPATPRDWDSEEVIGRYKTLMVEYEQELSAFHQRLSEYNAQCETIDARFREDLEAAFDMVGHPKADKVYKMAWDRGHYSGKEEVVRTYMELLDLIK